jgi:hypothetical protein
MTEEEKRALQDRFSGYQLPKIYLTAGFPSYIVPVHPYYYNQPLEWTKPAYTKYQTTGPQLLEGEYPIREPIYSESGMGSSSESSHGGTSEIAGSSSSSQAILRSRGDNSSSGAKSPPLINLLPF